MEKQPKLFNKGMSQDTNEEFQPDGSYRFMLNGILESSDGDKGSVINELGNKVCFTLPEMYTEANLLGACLLSDNRIVLFFKDNNTSIIGIQNTDCTFDVLIATDCLDFNDAKPIDCIFKLQNGCDFYIYFTDDHNPYRSINLNDLDKYKPNGNWDCKLMNLSPDFEVPDVYLNSINVGGNLRIGAYQFVFRYLDNSLNPTNWCVPTSPIYITLPPQNNVDMVMNNGGTLNPTVNDGFNYANKSITITIDNLDTRYKYYQLGILESTNGLGTINNSHITGAITMLNAQEEYTLYEISTTRNINPVDSSEITVPNLYINRIAAHAQIENKLLLANHQEEVTDWSEFQELANKIETEYFVYKGDNLLDIEDCGGYSIIEAIDSVQTTIELTTEGTEYLNTENSITYIDPGGLYNPALLTTVITTPTLAVPPGPYDPVTGLYTVPSNGYYQFTITVNITCADPSDGWRYDVKLIKNGLSLFYNSFSGAGTPLIQYLNIVEPQYLLVGDTVQLYLSAISIPVVAPGITMVANLKVMGTYFLDPAAFNNHKNYSIPIVSYDNKTYMRDEVYALGIVFVFKNGFETPVMHIPGRVKIGTGVDINDTSTATSVTIDGYVYDTNEGHHYWNGLGDPLGPGDVYNVDNLSDNWDTLEYTIGNTGGSLYQDTSGLFDHQTSISKCEYVGSSSCSDDTVFERWQHVNTSIKNETFTPDSLGCKHEYDVVEIGTMGYYDTDTPYPNITNCAGVPIYPHDTIITEIEGVEYTTYRMHTIRHHLMPDARKVPIHEDDGADRNVNTCGEEFYLYPIGVKYTNILLNTITDATTRNNIQGYYFVRGDRAGNKTVVDKGWMNVTDVTWGIDSAAVIGPLTKDDRTIEQNKWFLTPGWKNGYSGNTGVGKYHKQPQKTGFNVVEFFSPKSSFGETLTDIGGDYFKMERTMYGFYNIKSDPYVPSEGDDSGASGENWITDASGTSDKKWRLSMYGGFNKSRLPRQYNFEHREDKWSAPYKLPIQGSEYTVYNENNLSTVMNDFKLLNDNHRQTMMISKLFNKALTDGSCNCMKPQQTSTYNGLGQNNSGTEDIIPWDDLPGTASLGHTVGYAPTLWNLTDDNWIIEGQSATSGEIGRQFAFPAALGVFCRHLYSPYAYYVALKNNIRPYSKLENIKYIKTSNYIIEEETGTCFGDSTQRWITGGDCFIARQQLVKTYAEREGNSKKWKLGGSLLWGYVESEINAHYRHKEQGDDYYVYPWNSIDDTIYQSLQDLKEELIDQVEQLYHYKYDYSKDNNDRLNFPLSDEFDYCSDCSGKFPHVVYYSDTALLDEVPDKYRIFRALNNRTIPGDTGPITNLIIKEENLFAFTTNNLWKFNVAPQQMQTNNDVVQIGQASFLSTRPVKLFDNKQGTARGGMEFKFSGSFAGDGYFWSDNLSGKVFMLEKGVQEISQLGLKRFYRNNLMLKFRDQFKLVTGGIDYDILVTTSNLGVGFNSVYDPQYMRYILHKRDFTITPEGLDESGMLRIYPPPTPTIGIEGALYYSILGDGSFFVYDGISVPTSLTITKFEDFPAFFKNESFTLSYSIIDKAWASFHSYLPTFMYHDFDNFYTYYNQSNQYNNITWKHNADLFTNYCTIKQDFIIDIISNQSPYAEITYDTIEYTSNVFEYDSTTEHWKEIQLITFDKLYVYNNNQISNQKAITVSNPIAYQHVQYNVNTSYANKDRNFWRINRFRDMGVNRITSPESLFTKDWAQTNYRNNFVIPGVGYIDKVVNPNIIDVNKNPYKQLRFTDKFFGARLFFKPNGNYKINFNLGSNIKRNKL